MSLVTIGVSGAIEMETFTEMHEEKK